MTSISINVILSRMVKIPGPIKNTLLAFLNLIYPKRCQGCGLALHYKSKFYLCKKCFKKIKINRPPFCIKCGRHIYGSADLASICGKCINSKYNFDGGFFCCDYEGLIKELIRKFKYNYKKYLTHLFDELLVNFTENYININTIDMIVPVPLHRGKLQQRGFDQSLLLSKNLAKVFKLPLVYNILRRGRDTEQQTRLNKNERLNNVKGAFFIKPPRRFKFPGIHFNLCGCKPPNRLKLPWVHYNQRGDKDKKMFDKKRILLIDDVATTAATANECAAVLKMAGAKSVYLLTLAKGV
ncbi:MAG: ComF family protein [Candidatus Omnitrophota bacterium]|nr:MAG: ComF family protein [Candidatus Omnitrophota bacterium]